jgi:hypothetical protein
MMNELAIAIPILPGQEERWRRFRDQLRGPRNADFSASRERLGVRERTYHQVTPNGELVIVTLAGDNPAAAFARFGEAQDKFTDWFVEEVKAIHGVDLRQPPTGALPEVAVDSGARQQEVASVSAAP